MEKVEKEKPVIEGNVEITFKGKDYLGTITLKIEEQDDDNLSVTYKSDLDDGGKEGNVSLPDMMVTLLMGKMHDAVQSLNQ